MAKSEKVLKVTKADKTIHTVPLDNKAFYQHMNARILGPHEQMKLEEIDAEKAKDLPYIDETYITASEAPQKVADLEKEIEMLRAQLATNANQNVQKIDPSSASVPYVAESPVGSNKGAQEFTKEVKATPEANAPETNSVIEKKPETKK